MAKRVMMAAALQAILMVAGWSCLWYRMPGGEDRKAVSSSLVAYLYPGGEVHDEAIRTDTTRGSVLYWTRDRI